MDHFAGLDVSVKETSICIVDDAGKIVREVKEKWVRRFGASLPMRMTASWFGSLDLPDTRLWRD